MDLVSLQLTSANEFQVRHARRLLQERVADGSLSKDIPNKIVEHFHLDGFSDGKKVEIQLRLLWTLHATGGASKSFLSTQLEHTSEHVRWWAIQLLCEDRKIEKETLEKFTEMAKDDPSAMVRLSLASVMQRLPFADRWPIATNLASHEEDAKDANLPLMIWYAVEPAVAADTQQALLFASRCKIPSVRQHVARRLAED